jgi:hypothetical protein
MVNIKTTIKSAMVKITDTVNGRSHTEPIDLQEQMEYFQEISMYSKDYPDPSSTLIGRAFNDWLMPCKIISNNRGKGIPEDGFLYGFLKSLFQSDMFCHWIFDNDNDLEIELIVEYK